MLGLVFGFVLSMVIFPVQYSNVPPETLNSTDKDRYRVMIALAYQANQDIGRAAARLGLLRDDDVAGQLIQQSRRSQSRSDAQILLNMAQAIQNPFVQPAVNLEPTEVILTDSIPISESPSPTLTETIVPTNTEPEEQITATLVPTRLASTDIVHNSPTPGMITGLPYQLTENETICNPAYQESLIQVEVFDEAGEPIPNARITVSWSNGQNSFFTGFFPEISIGYADFSMNPSTIYNLQVGEIGELVTNLTSPECKDEEDNTFWGSLYLRFDAP
jgi:hypothetical protein